MPIMLANNSVPEPQEQLRRGASETSTAPHAALVNDDNLPGRPAAWGATSRRCRSALSFAGTVVPHPEDPCVW